MNKAITKVILFIFINICIFLFSVELFTRILFVNENGVLYIKKEELFILNSELGYSLKPLFSMDAKKNKLYPGISVKINSDGYRMDEFDERDKIAVFGDSVAFGFGLEQSDTISANIDKNKKNKFQVINAGVPGYNTEQLVTSCIMLSKRIKIKEVILLINANDFQTRYYPILGGATVTRSKSFPWDRDLIEESKISDRKDKILFFPIIIKNILGKKPIYTNFFKSNVVHYDDVNSIYPGEVKIIQYYNNGSKEVAEIKRKNILNLSNLINQLQSSNILVTAAFLPFRISACDEKNGKDKRFEEISKYLENNTKAKVILLKNHLTNASDWLPSDSHPSAIGSKKIALALQNE